MAVHDMLAAVNQPAAPVWDRPVGDAEPHNHLSPGCSRSSPSSEPRLQPGTSRPECRPPRRPAYGPSADEVHGLAVRLDGILPVPYLHRTERADLPHDPYMELVDSALTNVGLRPARWWSKPSGARLDGGFWLDTAHRGRLAQPGPPALGSRCRTDHGEHRFEWGDPVG
ncbi:hypothetical protein [Kitasatospora aureofaciens]|uniref:hypothetical protein n=1 Tax=Kitasatospora aureofaciens TaxID=1894 RepID=UPI0037CA8FC1